MIRIVSVEALPEYRLKVQFNDGLSGIFSVEPKRRGGVFLKLLDARAFNAVTINQEFGCVEWAGGIDLCPDTMHEVIAGAQVEENAVTTGALHEKADKKLGPNA